MKRLLITILMLVAFTAISFSEVERTGLIRPGGNILNKMTFTAADYVEADDTLSITISNIQKYMQHVTATYTLDSLSGSPSVGVTLYGKVTSNGSWTSIGTATWNEMADNPQSISSTTPAHYNWYKLEFIASGATQKVEMLTLDVRTSNVFDIPANSGTLTVSRATSGTVTIQVADDNSNAAAVYRAGGTGALTLGAATGTTAITSSDWAISATGAMTGIGAITADGLLTGTAGATISGATTSINASSNFATNLNTGSSTGALSLGGGSGTVAVNSTTWDISTAGVATGLTGVTVTADGDNVLLDPYHDLHAIDVQINSASKFNVDTTGVVTAAGEINANGGIVVSGFGPVIWAKGGAVALATAGTDKACSNGARWWVSVDIPYNITLTGIAYLVGSVGGTDSVMVHLYNSAGTLVATSRHTGATHGAIVGTAAQFQSVAFTTPYAAVSGKYFAAVQFNGTTAKFRTYPIPGCKFITGTAAGTWNVAADITPGTTFTADYGPILMTY